MTNRPLIYIVKDQKPLVIPADETVRSACRAMRERRTGSVLVVNSQDCLVGILTGRDVARLIADGKDLDASRLAAAMTPHPVTITPQARAVDAIRAMIAGGFRHVPVVENGKVRGVVSRGDFKGMEFEEFRWRNASHSVSEHNRLLADIVEKQQPIILSTENTVADACRTMCTQRVGSVLVADKRRRLKGIFTGRDVVRALANFREAAATRLGKVMTADPATMPPSSYAVDALRVMNDGGFRHLPVVEKGKILGVVSRSDFTGAEIDRLDEEEHLKECIW
jgi:CBS domain-containing protein